MDVRVATILLLCSACVLAQYNGDEAGGGPTIPKKTLHIPSRRLKTQTARLAGPTAQTISNQRFRRPIPINKPRPAVEPIPELPVFTSGIRGSRPSSASFTQLEQSDEPSSIPIQTIQQPHIIHAQSIPNAQPQPIHQHQTEEVKPVNEENDKDQDVVQVIANLGAVQGFNGQSNLLTPTASPAVASSTISSFLQQQELQHQQRQNQQERHIQRDQIQPIQYRPQLQISRSSPTPIPDIVHQVITPVQYRSQKPLRHYKSQPQLQSQQQTQQQFDRNEYNELSEAQKPVRHYKSQVQAQSQQQFDRNEFNDLTEARPVKQRAQVAPKKSKPQSDYYEGRTKKPVAQVIRRYREETADGSIIWGFENDDGSFKEEIIGIDCITRGKYGYVDPDGLRREYTYETGIKCDEETQKSQDQDILNTFVDYQENKLVLPSGKTIDLSSMGKKQARRPQPLYRN